MSSVTPERLAEKRRRAEQLRQEISTLQYAAQEVHAQADLANQDAALDEELARLEQQRALAAQNIERAGGSVADALAAMQAAEAEKAEESVPAPSGRPALGTTTTEGEGK